MPSPYSPTMKCYEIIYTHGNSCTFTRVAFLFNEGHLSQCVLIMGWQITTPPRKGVARNVAPKKGES